MLKMLQKDRRIDRGAKYSPVFGRYSFVDAGSEGVSVAVGDEVRIVRRNEAQTVFSKSEPTVACITGNPFRGRLVLC